MRCGCPHCEAYMIQSETEHQACVCPECGYRCRDCLGTDTVVSRDHLADLARDPRFSPESLSRLFDPEDAPEEDDDGRKEYW